MEVLRTENLTKYYGSIKALDKLNLVVEQGQILGLLGPNGSGKTTTLGLLLSILHPTSGSFTWFENKYGDNHRLKIGSILETPNFYSYLNADENLKIVSRIKKVDTREFDELLELVRLKGRRKSPFSTYSLGMKQRLAIAATMIGNPEVVIFDEPTNGLDPEGIAEVRSTLKQIASSGRTVIMASHILDEVEKICSHVAIIKHGKLLATGSVGSILSDDITIEISGMERDRLKHFLDSYPNINTVTEQGLIFECSADADLNIADLNRKAVQSDINITHLVSRKRRLEEEFLTITNQ